MEGPFLVLHQGLCYLEKHWAPVLPAFITTHGATSMTARSLAAAVPELAKWVGALMLLAAVVWTPGVIFVTGAWVLYGQQVVQGLGLATAEDVARIEQRIEAATSSLGTLSRDITILSRPDDVVNYKDLPYPVQGYCIAGQTCTLTIFAERHPDAVKCVIIPDRTELVIIANGLEYSAAPSASKPTVNLGPSARALEPAFQLPQSLEPGLARAAIRTYYTDCPWQINGQPPVMQDSPFFPLEIRS